MCVRVGDGEFKYIVRTCVYITGQCSSYARIAEGGVCDAFVVGTDKPSNLKVWENIAGKDVVAMTLDAHAL